MRYWIRFGAAEGGLFKTAGYFPVPSFGKRCACCNGPGHTTVEVLPGDDQTLTDAVPVPVCEACVDHLPRRDAFSRFKLVFFLVLLLVLISFPFFGLSKHGDDHLVAWLVGGLVLATVVTAALVLWRQTWLRRWAAQGHFRALELHCGPGFSMVGTDSAALAEALREAGGTDLPARR